VGFEVRERKEAVADGASFQMSRCAGSGSVFRFEANADKESRALLADSDKQEPNRRWESSCTPGPMEKTHFSSSAVSSTNCLGRK